jgi:hypothetical protein
MIFKLLFGKRRTSSEEEVLAGSSFASFLDVPGKGAFPEGGSVSKANAKEEV